MARFMGHQRSSNYQSLSSRKKVYVDDFTTKVFEKEPIEDVTWPVQRRPKSHNFRWRSIPNPFNYVWRKTIDDLRSIGWRTIFHTTYSHVLPILTIFSLLAVGIYLVLTQPVNSGQRLCFPDGRPNDFEYGSSSLADYNPWVTSEMFTINMGFGNLPFRLAKLIDVVWDTVFGRGGQALIAIISYRVLTSALTLLLEQKSVSLVIFEAITLEGSTITSVGKLAHHFRKNESRLARTLVSLMILSVTLILIFPTLASAMTGYTAKIDARINLFDNATTVKATDMQRVWYIIHDGSRLGQGFYDDYPVIDLSDDEPQVYGNDIWLGENPSAEIWASSRSQWMSNCSHFAPGKVDSIRNNTISLLQQGSNETPVECQLLWNMSRYTYTYGLFGLNDSTSSFYNVFEQKQMFLDSPVLNVTAYPPTVMVWGLESPSLSEIFTESNLAWSIIPFSGTWDTNGSVQGPNLYAYKGSNESTTLGAEELMTRLTCRQQSLETGKTIQYQWGFAFLPLILFITLLVIWTTINYSIHTYVCLHSKLKHQHRLIGLRRAVLDLAPEYQKHFACQDTSMWSEHQIKKAVCDGKISYEDLLILDDTSTGAQHLRSWWKAFNSRRWVISEWKWLTFMLLVFILIPVGSYTYSYLVVTPAFAPVLLFGTLSVLAAGRDHFSRWLLFVPFALVFVALQATKIHTWFL